ncbi:MAG: pyruvate formate lyase family protein [Erysipelotrichaceae bacterium]|nr:pyruvate formate lyase family protein [Erysipelotrichaceae bacterium]
MAKLTLRTVTNAEKENIRRIMEENPDPIGARNWQTDSSLIQEIKQLKRSDRINRIRNRYLDSKQQIYIKERCRLIKESYEETLADDVCVRQAKALAHVLENYPIIIREDELILGSVTPTMRGCLWFPEVSNWLIDEIDTISTRAYNPTYVSDEDKEYYVKEVYPYWKDRCSFAAIQNQLPDEVRENQNMGLWSCGISSHQHVGHILSLDKHRLDRGLKWYKEKAENLIKTSDVRDPKYVDKVQFWKSIIIICDAVHTFANRYADEALKLADTIEDETRKEELKRAATTLRKVPWEKADTFYEAVQSAWFMQLIYYYENNSVAQSPGRVDQKLYEYFKRDVIEQKVLSLEEAKEIMCSYWLKIAETNKVYNEGESRFRTGNPMFQNISLGGTDCDGLDAVNELSYLCLKVEEFIHLDQPNVAVWVEEVTPADFIETAMKVVRTGGGKPMFLGAKSRIEHFKQLCGLPDKAARSYDSVCCSFMWNPYLPNMDHAADINPGIALEYVFTNGKDRKTGRQVGPQTGDPRLFKNVDEIFEALKIQIEYGIKMACLHASVIYKVWEEKFPAPYTSMFQGTCLSDGMDITKGGSGGHMSATQVSVGLVNCLDSLAAIEKVVFEDKKATMDDIINALDADFNGYEVLQNMLLDAPKYGNDDEYVDKWIPKMQRVLDDTYLNYPMRFGRLRKNPVYIHLSAGVLYGSMMGATPDGRKAGMPVAEGGISPMQGLELHGPVASMISAAKWDYKEINSVVYNQKFHPRVLEKDEDIAKLSSLVKIFLCNMGPNQEGAAHVQINVVSADTLRDAQLHPENYRDLIIRVAGYTAFFTEISKDLQDDLIARVEFNGIQ